ncbi:SPOR domain-containing protein [Paraburkholderia tuberum]|uniref:Cell division protein FtsN n=1 Tax=Paraburkholderia tuberum TaxID=157910 RepID=A0A1H1E0K3_9BURK|nr:SPOR domain-containing protein [Paraburkholderia tuberum]SDQ82247.1 cell division protein FtsN [Paraburkholderia tuberum]
MAKPRRTTKQSKQTGGTFLGIVLGLIVGLAIAVVVALYITRAPTPFVSKVAPPAATDNGASQPQYDPNRPLQGKTPGQPVPQAAQPAPPNTAPGQTNAQTQSGMLEEPQIVEVPPSGGNANNNGTAVAPNPAQENGTGGTGGIVAPAPAKKPQTSSAPAATAAGSAPKSATTLANAKPGSPAAPAPGEANTGYFLQVGAYKTAADAEQQRARLGFQGFESKVTQRDAGGVTYYRVRIGPFSKFEDMNSSRQRLSDAGVDTAVIRFTKQ